MPSAELSTFPLLQSLIALGLPLPEHCWPFPSWASDQHSPLGSTSAAPYTLQHQQTLGCSLSCLHPTLQEMQHIREVGENQGAAKETQGSHRAQNKHKRWSLCRTGRGRPGDILAAAKPCREALEAAHPQQHWAEPTWASSSSLGWECSCGEEPLHFSGVNSPSRALTTTSFAHCYAMKAEVKSLPKIWDCWFSNLWQLNLWCLGALLDCFSFVSMIFVCSFQLRTCYDSKIPWKCVQNFT